MTKEEFIAGYCERSGVTWEYLSQHKVVLPCECDGDLCEGWAMVSNSPDVIKTHMELYAPKQDVTPNAKVQRDSGSIIARGSAGTQG